jgi:hypothetical protein
MNIAQGVPAAAPAAFLAAAPVAPINVAAVVPQAMCFRRNHVGHQTGGCQTCFPHAQHLGIAGADWQHHQQHYARHRRRWSNGMGFQGPGPEFVVSAAVVTPAWTCCVCALDKMGHTREEYAVISDATIFAHLASGAHADRLADGRLAAHQAMRVLSGGALVPPDTW